MIVKSKGFSSWKQNQNFIKKFKVWEKFKIYNWLYELQTIRVAWKNEIIRLDFILKSPLNNGLSDLSKPESNTRKLWKHKPKILNLWNTKK